MKMNNIVQKIRKINFNSNYWFLLLFIPFILLINSKVYFNNDLWFILNHGRYVLGNGFPTIEPFTIHEGLSFVMQNWLSSVIFWIVYNKFGTYGVFTLVYLTFALIIFFLYKLCMTVSNNKFCSILISALIAVFMVKCNVITSRPQIFSYLLLIVGLYVLENYMKSGKVKTLIWFPILCCLTSNLHASVSLFLPIFMLPFVCEGVYEKLIRKNKNLKYNYQWLIIFMAISLFAIMINPYKTEALSYLSKSLSPYINNFVAEMKTTNILTGIGLSAIFILFLNFIVYLKAYKEDNYFRLGHMFLLFGGLILFFISVKSRVYFFIAALYPLAYYLKTKLSKEVNLKEKRKKSNVLVFLIIIVICLSLTGVLINKKINFKRENILKDGVDFLEENYNLSDINIYIDYNNGGYTEFRGIKSYIDPRAEVFLKSFNEKEDIFEEFFLFKRGKYEFSDLVEKYNFSHLIIMKYEEDLIDFSKLENYSLVFENENYKIFSAI